VAGGNCYDTCGLGTIARLECDTTFGDSRDTACSNDFTCPSNWGTTVCHTAADCQQTGLPYCCMPDDSNTSICRANPC
jgi:hypothetical protein